MPATLKIEAEVRNDAGTGSSRRLRRTQDKVPGVLYGADQPTMQIAVDYRGVARAMQEEAFFSQILELSLNGQDERVVLRDIQRNPSTDRVVHMDFLRIREDRELHVSVPIHYLNEENCEGVRNQGGLVSRSLTEIEISCLPRDLPEFIEIDLEHMDIGDSVHLSEIDFPEGVTAVALTQGEDRDLQVVSVHLPRGVLEEEEEEVEGLEEELEDEEASDASDESPEDEESESTE